MGIKSLVKKGIIEVWDDIYDIGLDDKAAPDLSYILKIEDPTYSNPEEFFKRTYLTRSLEELIEDVADSLKSKSGRIFLLTSLFGGGKTHTLITLYHAFSNPEKLRILSDKLAARVAEVKPLIIVMDASRASLVPHPDEPYKTEDFTIKTIWGMLAYRLGAYAKIRHLDSEEAPAPETDLIKSILSETKEPILILMDEIVHYVFNMHKSKLRDYGEKVLLFLDYLARAVESTPNIELVASIQAEYRIVDGQRLLIEEEIFTGYASKILSVLSRESTRLITPVAPDDVIRVLQRRIFKTVPEEETYKARDRIYRIYRENPELFGVESDWEFLPEGGRIATVKDTYPFHPKYVEVLQEFVTRNKDLQKTRDAIRITRKVVRRLLRSKEDADFIMPWHIDLRDKDIRNRVLTDSRKEFRDVASKDIATEEGKLGSVAECSKPNLALKMATSVLLKTYTYETFKEPLKVFPDLKTIALMVYEPESFGNEDLHPSDIKTTIEEMLSRLPHFTSESERYWFTPYPSVIDYVEKKAREKLIAPGLELYNVITEKAEGLLVRKREKERGEVFNEKDAIVVGYGEWGEVVIEDNPLLKLVVLIKPEVDEEEVRKIILMKGEGRRTFRNTVAVIYPSQANFDLLLLYAAKIKAAEEVKGTLGEYYSDKEIRSLQERKLKKYIQDNESLLNQQLLAVLTNVAYPVRSSTGDDVKFITTTPLSSIISQAEAGLKDPSTGPKLRIDFSFADLVDFLKRNQNWDLVDGGKRIEFRDIVNVFYTTTAAPFTTRGAIQRALLEGVESLDTGVEMDGQLYWKDVDDIKIPRKLKDTAEILPYRLAASILKDKLLKESGEHRVGKKVHIVWYEIGLAGKKIRLEDLILQKGWEKVLKEGKIIKQEEVIEKGFFLKLSQSSVEVMPGEMVEVSVEVKPIDEYSEEVKLAVNYGSLNLTKGKPSFNAIWSFTAPSDPGDYTYAVEATSNDIIKKANLFISVKSLEEEVEVEKLDLTHVGAKLLSISTNDSTNLRLMLDVVSKLNLNADADVRMNFGDSISFAGYKMNVKIAGLFVQKFADILRSLPSLAAQSSVSGSVKFIEPVILDNSKINVFSPLKAKFKLRVSID